MNALVHQRSEIHEEAKPRRASKLVRDRGRGREARQSVLWLLEAIAIRLEAILISKACCVLFKTSRACRPDFSEIRQCQDFIRTWFGRGKK